MSGKNNVNKNTAERVIKDALDANGYEGGISGEISSEEMASIIISELQDQGIFTITPIEAIRLFKWLKKSAHHIKKLYPSLK